MLPRTHPVLTPCLCLCAAFLALSACAHAPPTLRHRVCNPVGIRAGASASPAVRAALERAIAYWHWEMGREVFRLDPVASVVVEQRDLRAAGRAYTTTREGCLRKARVIISHDSAVRYPEVLESVMRHELGHVLGLRDTPGAGVMDPQLALPDFLSEPHPLEVRVPELLLLR